MARLLGFVVDFCHPGKRGPVVLCHILVVRHLSDERNDGRWEAKTGREVAEVSPPEGATVRMLAVAGDNTTAAAAWGTKLNAFDLVGGKVLREFDTGGRYAQNTPLFAPDGRTFAIGFGDGGSFGPATIRVYEWATGRVVRSYKGHDAAAFSLAFSADGKTLASGSLGTPARVKPCRTS